MIILLLALLGFATADSDWIANPNHKFKNFTIDQLRSILTPLPKNFRPSINKLTPSNYQSTNTTNSTLPLDFSWRDTAPECMVPSLDQGECGSCYAHASVHMLAERLCISQEHHVNKTRQAVPLSPDFVMFCDPLAYGCNGGMISQVVDFLSEDSSDSYVPPLECIKSFGNETLKSCPEHKCPPKDHRLVKCKPGSKVQLFEVEKMKEELLKNGPLVTQMVVYEDLLSYQAGVYEHRQGSIIGGHAVLITGWGYNHKGEEFWEVQNSWGADWGENNGFFRIKVGDSEIATQLFGGALACEVISKETIFYERLFMQ
ncbi:hypothetical protein FGO68_gene13960 [Halteria grandinella]|uniref:Peptidase C1A papain C-terminal domain-containing protein n=1 Tax=Halteria grandinella TaxID=5974 RepID=A0A8J8NK46_HALGN|nr:hypothetical protein FGO68_gene13960 [Halteria grandinella]